MIRHIGHGPRFTFKLAASLAGSAGSQFAAYVILRGNSTFTFTFTYLHTYLPSPLPRYSSNHLPATQPLSCSAAQLLVATRSPDYQLPGGPPGSHSPPLSHIFLNNTGTPILITTTTYSLKPTLILPSIFPVPKWVSSAPTLRSWFRTRMKSASIRFHIP